MKLVFPANVSTSRTNKTEWLRPKQSWEKYVIRSLDEELYMSVYCSQTANDIILFAEKIEKT